MEEDSPEGWFYLTPDGVENGPLNFRIIRAHLRLGTLPSNIPVWREGLSDWTEAKNVSLFSNFGHGVPSSPAVNISRCRREMKLEWPMLTSTEPCDEFRPMVTDLFFIRYSNSRPSSRATADPDIPLTTAIF